MTTARDNKSLTQITAAARRKRLSVTQLETLRGMIAELGRTQTQDELLRRSIYNARVFDTQLRIILERLDSQAFTPQEFKALPPYLQARLKTRFKNIAERFGAMVKALEQDSKQSAAPLFQCKQALDDCLKTSPRGMNRLWCQIAMAACLATMAYRMAMGD